MNKACRKRLKAVYKLYQPSPPSPTLDQLVAALREIDDTHFESPSDEATYIMLCLYKDKLSPKGLAKWKKLRARGKMEARALFEFMVYMHKSILALIPEDEGFKGVPVPIKYDNDK